jgi:hypothetical protein
MVEMCEQCNEIIKRASKSQEAILFSSDTVEKYHILFWRITVLIRHILKG